MLRIALLLSLCLLTACGSNSKRNACAQTPLVFSKNLEKRVIQALGHAQADDSQRASILGAFDEVSPQLKALSEQSNEQRDQWRKLSPAQEDFVEQTRQLAEADGALRVERSALLAQLQNEAATVLSTDQYVLWWDAVRGGVPKRKR